MRVQTAAARPARGLVKVSAACYASPSAPAPPDRVGVGSGKGSLMTWAWFLFLWECFLRGCAVCLRGGVGSWPRPSLPNPALVKNPNFLHILKTNKVYLPLPQRIGPEVFFVSLAPEILPRIRPQ